VVAGDERVGQRPGHGQIRAREVTHHLGGVRPGVDAHEAVHRALVPLLVHRIPVVRRIDVVVRAQAVDLHRAAVAIGVGHLGAQALDRAPLQQAARAQHVVERAVLHAQHDERVDAGQQFIGGQRGGGLRVGRHLHVGRGDFGRSVGCGGVGGRRRVDWQRRLGRGVAADRRAARRDQPQSDRRPPRDGSRPIQGLPSLLTAIIIAAVSAGR
jgi:hypothetical protein